MAYTKTNWTESTPITVDMLNKIETGVENAIDKTAQIMEIPIVHSDGWHQFRWTKPGATTVSWTRDVARSKAFEVYNENLGKTLLLSDDNGNLTAAGNLYAGKFSIENRDLKIHNKRAMVGFDTADGNYLSINYDRDFAEGVRIHGLVQTETLAVGEKLAFSNYGVGGGLNANIHNLALHAHTGNGQMMTAGNDNRIYVGNPQTPLVLESNVGIVAHIGGAQQRILTDTSPCNRFSWNGSRISIDGGGNNAAVNFSDVSEIARHLHNHHNGQNLKLRASAGLSPVDGWITMTW